MRGTHITEIIKRIELFKVSDKGLSIRYSLSDRPLVGEIYAHREVRPERSSFLRAGKGGIVFDY